MKRMHVLLFATMVLHYQSVLSMNILFANQLGSVQQKTVRSAQLMKMSVSQRAQLQDEMRKHTKSEIHEKKVDDNRKTITYYIHESFSMQIDGSALSEKYPNMLIGVQNIESHTARRLILRIGDITKLQNVDAIVNAANAQLSWGGGVCGAIFYAAGGAQLEKEVTKVLNGRSSIGVGEAVITPIPVSTQSLPTINNPSQNVKYVIHAVGPDCRIPEQSAQATTLLANAYINSIARANEAGLKSIAFPAISTAIFRCPIKQASPAAIDAMLASVVNTDIQNINCVFFSEDENYKEYIKILDGKLVK